MSGFRAGVIGAGAFGRHHARKYADDTRVSFAGVYDPDGEKAEMLAQMHQATAFETPDALMAAVDMVTIASPPATHAAMAKLALAAGKHVLVEKPLAASVADGEELVALADDKGVVLACGHQERLVIKAIGLLDAPERPTLIESVRSGPWTGRSADVSVTLDLVVHDIDLALALLGEAPETVRARGRRELGPVADSIDAAARFPSGAQARFSSSRVAEKRARTMRLVYPSGTVEIDFVARTFRDETPFGLDADFLQKPDAADPLGANVRRFVDAVSGEAPRPVVTGAEALEALKLALAIDAQLAAAE
ncbi:MAG: Gfo/Idh/MocA family oxidoreductase [Hyphomonadaceae bacterium]|nr:Gfo/Idh/MocA family oxidoreductase [Hyphomonadaceae bacterium]